MNERHSQDQQEETARGQEQHLPKEFTLLSLLANKTDALSLCPRYLLLSFDSNILCREQLTANGLINQTQMHWCQTAIENLVAPTFTLKCIDSSQTSSLRDPFVAKEQNSFSQRLSLASKFPRLRTKITDAITAWEGNKVHPSLFGITDGDEKCDSSLYDPIVCLVDSESRATFIVVQKEQCTSFHSSLSSLTYSWTHLLLLVCLISIAVIILTRISIRKKRRLDSSVFTRLRDCECDLPPYPTPHITQQQRRQ